MYHPKADEVKRVRFQFKMLRYALQQRSVVYLDESGFEVDAPRTHGYTRRGKRCYDQKDWHSKGRINVIGAIDGETNHPITMNLWDCNVNSDVFYAWTTHALIPKLKPNSVIVLDNATFHKRQDILEALETSGHTVEFLPPYSPDLNPIEHFWAKAKAIRRRLRCSPFQLFSYDFESDFIFI